MSKKSRICNACGAEIHKWRSCPDRTCGREFCYCDEHGGDERAAEAMRTHIAITHAV